MVRSWSVLRHGAALHTIVYCHSVHSLYTPSFCTSVRVSFYPVSAAKIQLDWCLTYPALSHLRQLKHSKRWCSGTILSISQPNPASRARWNETTTTYICYFIPATITRRPSIKAVCCPARTSIGKEVSPKNYTHLPQQTEISSIQNKPKLLTNIIKLWSIPSQDGRCLPFGSEQITADGFQSSFAGDSCPPQLKTRLGDWCERAEE